MDQFNFILLTSEAWGTVNGPPKVFIVKSVLLQLCHQHQGVPNLTSTKTRWIDLLGGKYIMSKPEEGSHAHQKTQKNWLLIHFDFKV